MSEPHELSAAEAARHIRQRALSPLELAESLLGRIDALDPSRGAAGHEADRRVHPPTYRMMERNSDS